MTRSMANVDGPVHSPGEEREGKEGKGNKDKTGGKTNTELKTDGRTGKTIGRIEKGKGKTDREGKGIVTANGSVNAVECDGRSVGDCGVIDGVIDGVDDPSRVPEQPPKKPNRKQPIILPDKTSHSPYKLTSIPHDHIAEVLAENNGKIARTASALHVSHWTLKKYIDKHPDLLEILNFYREAEIDEVEDSLLTLVRSGNVAAAIFYLKCHGKGRGWIERPVEDKTVKKPSVSFKYTLVVQDREGKGKGRKEVRSVTLEGEGEGKEGRPEDNHRLLPGPGLGPGREGEDRDDG